MLQYKGPPGGACPWVCSWWAGRLLRLSCCSWRMCTSSVWRWHCPPVGLSLRWLVPGERAWKRGCWLVHDERAVWAVHVSWQRHGLRSCFAGAAVCAGRGTLQAHPFCLELHGGTLQVCVRCQVHRAKLVSGVAHALAGALCRCACAPICVWCVCGRGLIGRRAGSMHVGVLLGCMRAGRCWMHGDVVHLSRLRRMVKGPARH
mmetsp:Transcript_13961/g.30177  ORF Transcript_13961/g.30177 Transcript_13961/m.30177 type:complete len:203 (+) Transcript_13961:1500-2108(+)